MPTKKRLKVYKLYDGPTGPTAQSKHYTLISKNVYHVAAFSVKQAVLLAARREWSTRGRPGLLEYSDASQKWYRADGTASWHPTYRNLQPYRGEPPRTDSPAD